MSTRDPSIVSIREHKRNSYICYEDEPPDKKLISDGDVLVKELYAKQTNTQINLTEQLLRPKLFEKASDYVPITSYTAGTSDLGAFEDASRHCEEIERLKCAGLTADDISLYYESKSSEECLLKNHKNLDPVTLKKRLANINELICKSEQAKPAEACTLAGRHRIEFALSVKPQSIETKLLKFALDNKQQQHDIRLPHPMDKIKQIEQDLVASLNNIAPVNISKIRKKARHLANKLNPKEKVDSISEKCTSSTSKWDVKTPKNDQPKLLTKETKTYGCKQENFYMVCDGEIIKLSASDKKNKLINDCKEKLSVEEIRKLPRFENYNTGTPNKTLFIKNLPRNIGEVHLKLFFQEIGLRFDYLRLMNGRMRGQAFVTFSDEKSASCALDKINGKFIGNKPAIVEFAKGTNKNNL